MLCGSCSQYMTGETHLDEPVRDDASTRQGDGCEDLVGILEQFLVALVTICSVMGRVWTADEKEGADEKAWENAYEEGETAP